MKTPILYAMADGEGNILGVTSGPYYYIECDDSVDDSTHYVDVASRSTEVKASYEYELSVTGLSVTLNGVPSGATVAANGAEMLADDEPTVVEFDVPGVYEIQISGLAPYINESFEVSVGKARR